MVRKYALLFYKLAVHPTLRQVLLHPILYTERPGILGQWD